MKSALAPTLSTRLPLASALTVTGHRENNEDAFVIDPELGLFAVADGMGGSEGGEIASRLALAELRSFLRDLRSGVRVVPDLSFSLTPDERVVDHAIRQAHLAVIKARTVKTRRMGTTLATLFQPRPGAPFVVAHVGDSRVYRYRGGELVQLTRDHSFIEDLREAGAIVSEEDMPLSVATRLTRAVGQVGGERPTVTQISHAPGDRFLLCTDGLSGALDEVMMASHLNTPNPAVAARKLVDAALAHGSRDNITAVVVCVS